MLKVVDAIDNIDSKVALLDYCHRNGIKIVSSMGAGCKVGTFLRRTFLLSTEFQCKTCFGGTLTYSTPET